MKDATKAGFYGTSTATYYVTAEGRIWCSSVDFDGVREASEVPTDATPIGHLMTPDEMAVFVAMIED